ncbi:MAG: hypothetical protein ACLR8Y_02040 [Alistipes indistinctus]
MGIMYSGEVNDKAMPYSIDVTISNSNNYASPLRKTLMQALPTLVFYTTKEGD